MKKPKVEKVNLPYASTVASFFGDQGAMQSDSFLGRLFKGVGRTVVKQGASPGSSPVTVPAAAPSNRDRGGFGRSGSDR